MNNRHNFKIIGPCRNQIEMSMSCLDDLIPADHKARAIWDFVNKMDTTSCFDSINTFYKQAGRPTTCPKVLLALWLYSILDGNSSARKLEELCEYHAVYKWLRGGAPINRTMLAEFRSHDTTKFDDLLTSCLAVMVQAGLIKDEDFSQDGTRVKANAGVKSYRREGTLLELKQSIKEYIKKLDAEGSSNKYEQRVKEASRRIAQNRLDRVDAALKNLEEAREEKIKNREQSGPPPTEKELGEVRDSTTDPEARKMKMGDGGFRLAYNVQFATGLDSRVIYGVGVVKTADPGTAPMMMCRVHHRLKKIGLPEAKNWIGDAAYSSKKDIESVAGLFPGCRYYAPPKTHKGVDPKKAKTTDSEPVKKWRKLIDTDEVKQVYQHRSSTAEFSNAQTKNIGMNKFSLRGLIKVRGEALLYAIVQNISRYFDLIGRKNDECVSGVPM